jgi:hypothetical protein
MHAKALSSGAVIAVVLFAGIGRADETDRCSAAYESAQRLRNETKLLAAREALIACNHPTCPADLRKDCVEWLDEVNRSLPSVVVQAIDSAGCDLVDGRLRIDDRLMTDRFNGKPVELDPGVHVATIEQRAPHASISRRFVLSAGDKNRPLTASFAEPGAVCGVPKRRHEDTELRPVPWFVYALGGAGLLSLGISSGFYASGFSKKGTLDDCRPACASRDVDSMRQTFLVGDVLATLGVASLGAAAILYLTR